MKLQLWPCTPDKVLCTPDKVLCTSTGQGVPRVQTYFSCVGHFADRRQAKWQPKVSDTSEKENGICSSMSGYTYACTYVLKLCLWDTMPNMN